MNIYLLSQNSSEKFNNAGNMRYNYQVEKGSISLKLKDVQPIKIKHLWS